jgi:hypothetical protein
VRIKSLEMGEIAGFVVMMILALALKHIINFILK